MYNPNAKRRRIKPYARPTSFDYNVRYDIRQYQDVKYNRIKKPFFQAASNDEVFRVMEGELLAKSNNANARYNDKELHVFSFANGLNAPENTAVGGADREFAETSNNSRAQQREIRRGILTTIQYMGVAVTEFAPARDVYEQGFVATIAGLNTLYNNGAETIYPGQTVCMDLPILREASSGSQYKRALQMGVPREKLQFILRPHSDMVDDYGDLSLVNRFIVGTAISYSRPGDTVDVILHRMNYTSSSVGGALPAGDVGSGVGGDARDAVIGKFLARMVDADEVQNVYEGIVEFEEARSNITDPAVSKALDVARGNGANAGSIADLVKADGLIAVSERKLRAQILEQNRTAIVATAGLNANGARPADVDAAIQRAKTGAVAVGADNDFINDDVDAFVTNKANAGVEELTGADPVSQLVQISACVALLNGLVALGAGFDAEFGTKGGAKGGLAGSGNGVGSFKKGKAPGALLSINPANKALSLAPVPSSSVSSAVGSSGRGKKKK
jgi:hypothetical protein